MKNQNELLGLVVRKQDEELFTESRLVAELVDKRHDHLLRDIKRYVEVLESSPTLSPTDFFVESIYKDSFNRERPCYLITKKGCEMIGNKLTGEKGILFTATYVERFNKMEEELKEQSESSQFPTSYRDALLQLVKKIEENERLQLENSEMEPKATYYDYVL